tara:strand:- start:21735 stop:22607 length:873 start_codon:yes stop_codon:yes gene_type:complete
MKSSKSHFRFSRKQRNGIFLLVVFILVIQALYIFADFRQEPLLNTQTSEILSVQKEIDSLKEFSLQARAPKIYPFNPNFITEYRGYTLGMTPEEIDRLHQYRAQDQWINSKEDFKRVTQVSDSLLAVISPYFKFPEWVTNPRPKSNAYSGFKEKSFAQKQDLNTATAEDLQKINGVGEVLSDRIIKFRNRLNGFLTDDQLFDVYGLEFSVVKRIQNEFTVKQKPDVVKMNINKASASDMATLPFISFELAKEIVDYRWLHERFDDIEELKKVKGFPVQKFERFALYLTTE